MRQVVVDASVVLRRFLDGSPEAHAVLARNELAAPAVIVPETLNGLVKAGRFASTTVEDIARLAERFLRLPIGIVPDLELAAEIVGIASELVLSAYDAAYVALAERRGVPLVTADKRLARRYEGCELIA